jgi:hypothetical protein
LTHQNKLPVLPNTPKPISPTTTPSRRIKSNPTNESGVALTPRDQAGLARREDGDQVVLTSDGDEARVGRPGDAREGAEVGGEGVGEPGASGLAPGLQIEFMRVRVRVKSGVDIGVKGLSRNLPLALHVDDAEHPVF